MMTKHVMILMTRMMRMNLAKSLEKVEMMMTMSNRWATPTQRSVNARRDTLEMGSRFDNHNI